MKLPRILQSEAGISDAGGAGGNAPASGGDGGNQAGAPTATAGTSPEVSPGDGSGSPQGLIGDDGRFTSAFFDQFPSEKIGIFEKYGRDPIKIGNALVEAQTFMGRRLEVPNEHTDPAVVAEFRQRNGIPPQPEGYDLNVPEGFDESVKARWQQAFHEANLTQAQVNALAAVNEEITEALSAQAVQNQELNSIQNEAEQKQILQDLWGHEYDNKRLLAERAARTGNAPLPLEAIKDARLANYLAGIGEYFGEDQLVSANDIASPQSYRQQAKDIITNPRNPLYEAYQAAEPSVRQKVANLLAKAEG